MKDTHKHGMDRQLRLWTSVHSFCFLIFGVYLFFLKTPGNAQWTAAAAAIMGACSFTMLMLLQGHTSLTAPNGISLLRFVLSAAAAFLLLYGRRGWVVFALFAMAGLTDFFDGLAARRFGSTTFGAKLDMELDAFFIFMLTAVAVVYYGQKRLLLVAGLLRYAYVFLLMILPNPGEMPFIFRLLSKGACALAETALIILFAPFVGNIARGIMALVVVCLLCASFLRDVVMRMLLGKDEGVSVEAKLS